MIKKDKIKKFRRINKGYTHTPKGVTPKGGGYTHTPFSKKGVTPKGGGFTHTPFFSKGVTPKGGGYTHTPFSKKGVTPKGGGYTHTPKGVTPKGGGFTLVETLVALSIFTLSILGLMSVLTQGISDTTYAKSKNVAAYLAQEGIEYVRNIRDTYVLYSTSGQVGWDAFKTKMTEENARCDQERGCYFDDQALDYSNQEQPIAGIYMIECGATCEPLRYDSATGKYNYTTGVDSGFIRQIKVSEISDDEIKVFSTIYWTQGSGAHEVTFSENLYNWVE